MAILSRPEVSLRRKPVSDPPLSAVHSFRGLDKRRESLNMSSDDDAPEEISLKAAAESAEQVCSDERAATDDRKRKRRAQAQVRHARALAWKSSQDERARSSTKTEKSGKAGYLSERTLSPALLNRAAADIARETRRSAEEERSRALRKQGGILKIPNSHRHVEGLEVVDSSALQERKRTVKPSESKGMRFLRRVMYGKASNRVQASSKAIMKSRTSRRKQHAYRVKQKASKGK